MGSGDWNDGMNLVGIHGKGESVWLGFFLSTVLTSFAGLAGRRGDREFADLCRREAQDLRRNLAKHAWDGAWYRRAWFDDGSLLGTWSNAECSIDSIAQSWSVLSGAGDEARSRMAMDALDERLVRRDSGLIQLLDPPFDKSELNPGYIKGYVPGVRENGGQYTHAAVWAAMAFAALGDGRRAWELAGLINPLNHARTAESVAVYKVEPYVIAADVYGVRPHTGRGGWTWYTGAAGWYYRLIVESLLGMRREADRLFIFPHMRDDWDSFTLVYRFGDTPYRVQVIRDPTETGAQEIRCTLDGTDVGDAGIALIDDGGEHRVEVRVAGTR
jgi:cellobiose phosphorylase